MQRTANPCTPVRFRPQPPLKMSKRIIIFGLGYVGTSMAILLSQKNYVRAIDIDEKKVNLLNNKVSPIKDNLIDKFLDKKNLNLEASLDIEDFDNFDFVVIATPTDYDEDKDYFDVSTVKDIVAKVKDRNKNIPIIIKSTIPVGFTDEINSLHKCDNIYFSPEFLRENSALEDNLSPTRIIISGKSKQAKDFVNTISNCTRNKDYPILYIGRNEAESVKLFANTYLAMRVSFINELDNFGIHKKLNVDEIIKGISSDPRIGDFYNNPSFGYGGYCLPKDSKQLLANFDEVPQALISSVIKSNKLRKDFIAEQIILLKPKMVTFYRLAMKSESDNYRSAAIRGVIDRLKNKKIKLQIYEPTLDVDYYDDISVENNLDLVKKESDLIVCNRLYDELEDVKNKVFTRDIFGNN